MKKNTLLGVLAYVTLFLAGIIKVLNAIGLNLGTIGGVLAIICDLALVFTVVIAAHPFAKNQKHIAWYIIYWVLAAFAVFGAVYGGTKLF